MNADAPDTIRGMAREYFDAGSDIVLTNTFGGTKFRLKHYDAQDRVQELNALAAEHAKSQAGPGQYVAGSVGPTGEFIEPLGMVSESEMYDAFTEQIVALEEGGADAVMIETQMVLDEAQIAIKATRENTGPRRHGHDGLRQRPARLLHHVGHPTGRRRHWTA